MRLLLAIGAVLAAAGLASQAWAQAEYSGKLVAAAQILEAPGPFPSSRGTLAAGTPVEAEVCFSEGAYCLVSVAGTNAFVEGKLIEVPVDGGATTALELERRKWERIRLEAALPRAPEWERRNIVVWGDSLSTASSPNASFGDELQQLLGGTRNIAMRGVPGENGEQIGNRMLADNRYTARLQILWDRHYTAQTVDSYMADMRRLTDRAEALGNRFIIVSDIADLDGTTDESGKLKVSAEVDAAATDRINAALKARYPDNFVDVTAALSSIETRTDGLHLTQAGYDAVAEAIAEFIRARRL